MGSRFVEPVSDTVPGVWETSKKDVPMIYLLSKGADPTDDIQKLARKMKLPPPMCVSLGEGQEPVGMAALKNGCEDGTWALLQNCELGLGLMEIMEDLIIGHRKTGIDENFRLFMTCMPSDAFPLSLLQISSKIAGEPPSGLKAGMLSLYTTMVDQDRLERVEGPMWKKVLFLLCFLHTMTLERRKFGFIGWCIPYDFGVGDISAVMLFFEKHLYTTNSNPDWGTCQYMHADVQYGSRISDLIDRRMSAFYATAFCNWNVLEDGYEFMGSSASGGPSTPINPIPKNFSYQMLVAPELKDYHAYINTFPESDSPEIFGLHPNADLTFQNKAATSLIDVVSATQPKGGGGGGGGPSREDKVSDECGTMLSRMPEDYIEDDYKAKIQKLGGLAIPLNIYLFQEIQRLQDVIAKAKFMARQLQLAIKGEVVMTADLAEALDAIGDSRVPKGWVYTATGDEFSWIVPTMGGWFSQLLARDVQNRTWMETKRPDSYWMTGFFNPQGFMTAMKQEVTRKHRDKFWALDDMIYHSDVTQMALVENVKSPASEGVYIHGLTMDGAGWNIKNITLTEPEPKVLFSMLPVLHASANHYREQAKVNKAIFPHGWFECAIYKFFMRSTVPPFENFWRVVLVNLRCPEGKPSVHWGLRGLALLCNADADVGYMK
jgi:dynein heavy chain